MGEDAWFEGGHVLADAIALLALAQVDDDGVLVVFLLFGPEDVRGWFTSHGAQEGIAACKFVGFVHALVEGSDLAEAGGRCMVDIGDID